MSTLQRFNPFAPGFRLDPYPAYEIVRRAKALRTLGTLVLARHGDVSAALKSRSLGVDLIPQAIVRHAQKLGIEDTALAQRFIRNSLVFTDNPAHVRLRRLLNQVFTPDSLSALAPLISRRVDAHIADFGPTGFDAIAGLAEPLPTGVLCEWMGVPAGDGPNISRHIHSIRLLLDPGVNPKAPFQKALQSLELLTDYFLAHAKRMRILPGRECLVTRLAAARLDNEGLSREEVAFACIMCFVAGGETTQGLIGNTLHLLIQHPAQMELLRSEPSRWISPAIEESIRHETPLQLTKRLALEDSHIGDEPVAAGEQILLCLGGANRDPAVFEDPDRFDIARKGPAHVGFGHGMHACLGGALARMQAQIAVQAVIERYPVLERAQPLQWQSHSLILRGLANLHVRARPRFRWLRCDPKSAAASAHLVCFPHAGGSAASFAAWRQKLPAHIAVHRVELPKIARMEASREFRRVQDLARDLAQAFCEALESGSISPPYAFYGHSLGALVAYELAHSLRERGLPSPVHLFVSGRRAPGCALRRPALCALPEPELVAELAKFRGIPDPVLTNARWFKAMLTDLRAELALSDLYEHALRDPLDCAIHAFMGQDDPILDRDELLAWKAESRVAFGADVLPGAHFFADDGLTRLRQAIVDEFDALARLAPATAE